MRFSMPRIVNHIVMATLLAACFGTATAGRSCVTGTWLPSVLDFVAVDVVDTIGVTGFDSWLFVCCASSCSISFMS